MSAVDLRADLALALDIADRADAATLPHFLERDFRIDWKDNQTEVTEVDRDVEALVVSQLTDARPGHAVVGEEHGEQGDVSSPWRWFVDPIDGTSGFVRGVPVWGTLIALTHAERGAVIGVVSAPALGRRWWAARGEGAHMSALGSTRELMVSSVDRLGEAQVSVTHSRGWDELGLTDALVGIQRAAHRSRGMGDFWQHVLVAEGAMDVAIDAVGVAPYDVAAIQPIVEEAGGAFTDRHGRRTYLSGTAISSNGLLHDGIIAALTG